MLLFDNVLFLIWFFMDNFLEFFQTYQDAYRMPKAPMHVCTHGDQPSHERMRGTHPSVEFLSPYQVL